MDIDNRSIGLIAQIELAHQTDFDVGHLRLRPSLREVEIAGDTVTLEPRVMQVLVALARDPGEVVSKLDLIQTCWDGREVGDDAISRCIAAIRRLAKPGGVEITTIPRVGYRLTVSGSEAAAPAVSASAPPLALAGTADTIKLPSSPKHWALAAMAGLILSMGALWYAFGGSPSPAPLSVAVLPFDADGTDATQRDYAEDISKELAARISPLRLDVISPAHSMRYAGETKHEAYAELASTYVIDGSVRRENDTVRVNVHLDNRRTGEVLFSKSFAASAAESAALGRRVSAAMADRMRTLSDIDPSKPDQAREMLDFWDTYRTGNPNTALAMLTKIAGESPDWGKLQLHHANVKASVVWAAPLDQRKQRYREAVQLSRKVERIEPGNALHALMRFSLTPASDWFGREAALRAGMEAPTGNEAMPFFLGNQLLQAGYLEEAARTLGVAVERDPNSFWPTYDVATAFRLLQRWDLASNYADRLAGIIDSPQNRTLYLSLKSTIAHESGDYGKADQIMASSPLGQMKVNKAYKVMNDLRVADKTHQPQEIAVAIEECRTADFALKIFGMCLPVLSENGELDLAFAHLDPVIPHLNGLTEAEREENWLRSMDMPFSRFSIPQLYHPRNAAIRADPRFVDLAYWLNLIDYWRKKGPPDFCRREKAPVCEMVKRQKSGGDG